MFRSMILLVVMVSMLSAFQIDVVKQFPATINAGESAQAEYRLVSTNSTAYLGFVKFSSAQPDIKVYMNTALCALNASENTFVCNGWLGTGNNFPKINISIPLNATPITSDISVWFELIMPTVYTPPPAPVFVNVTKKPTPSELANSTAKLPLPPNTTRNQSNQTPIQSIKPIIPQSNTSPTITQVTQANNSTVVPIQSEQPNGEFPFLLVAAAFILVIGVAGAWWFIR